MHVCLLDLQPMRRFSATEKGVLALSAVMMICGVWMIFFPSEQTIPHPGFWGKGIRLSPWVEHVSMNQNRIYGGLAVLMGTGMLWLVVYRGKK